MERIDIYALVLLFLALLVLSIFGMFTAYIAGKSEGFSQGIKYYKNAERAIRTGKINKVRIID